MILPQIAQDNLQNIFIDFRLNETVRVWYDGVGPACVESGDDIAVPVQSHRILGLIAVMPRMFHAADGFHFFLDIGKTANPFEAVRHLIPLKLLLLLIRELLNLAAATLSCHRAGRFHPVRRWLDDLCEAGVAIVFLQFRDGDLHLVSDDRVLNK